jgi:chromosome segregation ATPase
MSKRTPRTRQETQTSLHNLRNSTFVEPALGQADLTEARKRAAMAISNVEPVELEKTVQKLTSAGLEVNKLLAKIQATFTEEFGQVQILREALVAYRNELESLYGKDVIQSDLRDLLAEHDLKMETLRQQYADAMATHNRAIEDMRMNFETQKAGLERTRQQQEADYVYRVSQSRRQEEAQYAEQKRIRDAEERDRREAVDRDLSFRQSELDAKETEFNELKAKAATFDETVKKEADRQVAIATNSLKKDLVSQFALDKKDLEAQLSLARAENLNLQKAITATEQRNSELQAQVKEANGRIEAISKAALDSASGKSALAAVQSYAETTSNATPARR